VWGAYRVPNLYRWLSSKKVETVRFGVLKQCPIALLSTSLHNHFQVRALLAGALAALSALTALTALTSPSHTH